MKKKYIAPELEVVKFDIEDIITLSGVADKEGDTEFDAPGDWWS